MDDTSQPVLQAQEIRKSFGRNLVLDNVDFDLRKGEIHALVGGNGAGKSTLMKIITGVYSLDSGTLKVDGQQASFNSPLDAQRHGIAIVFQEFSLVPTLSVAQNIFLAREPKTAGTLLNDRAAERRSAELLRDLGVSIDPRTPVENLSTGQQQITEIAKALSQGAHILILDEPTSSLSRRETETLFDLLRRLKAAGIAMVYISHRLEEIFEVCDRVSVLRDGRLVASAPTAELTMPQVIEHIVGRKMGETFEWKERPVRLTDAPLLEVSDLVSGDRLHGISFAIHPGEILGIAGIMGSGRTELARCLFGIDRIKSGEVRVDGRRLKLKEPYDAVAAGIVLIPEDRRRQGLVLDHPIRDNIVMAVLDHLGVGRFVNDRQISDIARTYVERLEIRTDSIYRAVNQLSGGNQQKVVVAKWLVPDPRLLVMDEPTVGVDIATKAQIIEMIRSLADQGKAIIIISSEFPELLAVSDRILIMRDGVIKRELPRAEIEREVRSRAEAGEGQITTAEKVLQEIVQGA